MLRRLAAIAWVWGSTLLVAAGVLVACGGAHHAASPRAPETDPTTSVSSPSYGQILTAQDPRILQFGFKVLF